MEQVIMASLAIVALGVVIGILTLLLRPLVAPALNAVESAVFRRALAQAARGDSHLRDGDTEAALRAFEHAFCLLTIRGEPRLAEQVVAHHHGLLSRLLAVADELHPQRVRLFALAKVDRFLSRRAEMQRAFLTLRPRGLRDGRRLQLGRELRQNARATREAIRELVADIQMLRNRQAAVQ
jgi:hypothetical protein